MTTPEAATPKTQEQTEPKSTLITKDMILGDIVAKHPETASVMMEYGLHCVGCFANAFDTVEAGAMIHGLTPEQIDKMLLDMNEVAC